MDLERDGQTSALPQRVLRTLGRVTATPIVQRHPALRWLAPLAVAGVVGVVATGVLQASATSPVEDMPETTAASLLTELQQPVVTGFSGTVVSRLSLGLPELPTLGASSDDASDMSSLLAGSHTLKVWYGGPSKQRVALLGATDETDVFRSGDEFWKWTSADRTAEHGTLPEHSGADRSGIATPMPQQSLTPGGIADDLLRRLDPSTKVTVSSDHRIANRAAYELVLTPRTTATRIGRVRVAVDGETKLPLGVQVFARGSRTAAIDVAFTSVTFEKPADTVFTFNPPDDAQIVEHDAVAASGSRGSSGSQATPGNSRTPLGRVTTSGQGWATVWRLQGDAKVRKAITRLQRGPLADAATPVRGAWGSGRLFTSDLASVLVVDDGRVLAGAVDPSALYAAAAK